MKLELVTFSDKPLLSDNLIVKAAERLSLDLSVLSPENKWLSNSVKIKLLLEHLESAKTDHLLLIVDAFDVDIIGTSASIISSFEKLQTDVLFSAEANFYFREKKLRESYWKVYPRSPTPYHFLNSGSFMGRSVKLLIMLKHIKEAYFTNFSSEELKAINSDQYLYSRMYVDNYYRKTTGLNIKLDHEQTVFGCTGGRSSASPGSITDTRYDLWTFKVERALLKVLRLTKYQTHFVDFQLNNGRLFNKKTESVPQVIHLPGSKSNFEEHYKILNGRKKTITPLFARLTIELIFRIAKAMSLLKKVMASDPSQMSDIKKNKIISKLIIKNRN